MADKNLHDIKIDELDSPKKTPLKNILTLLALLFIILVISVVITKLILNTDEGEELESNVSTSTISTEVNGKEDEKNSSDSSTATNLASTAAAATAAAVPVLNSKIPERNVTSVTKAPLRTHTPKKDVKEVKTPKTYKTPKHTSSKTPKKSNSTPKKQYIDKVVVKKAPKKSTTSHQNTTAKKSSSKKKAPYLGGKQVPVTNSYYIKVGTYRDTSAIVSKIKKNNFNYSLVKLKDDKTMTRVFVGPFFSENQAEKSMPKVKANILSGAYITKVK